MNKYHALLYMGRIWITDWFGGVRAWKVDRAVYLWLPEALRIMQVTRN